MFKKDVLFAVQLVSRDRLRRICAVDILAFKVSRLGLEEGQAIGRLLRPVGELEGEFLSTTKHVGQLQTQDLENRKHTDSL